MVCNGSLYLRQAEVARRSTGADKVEGGIVGMRRHNPLCQLERIYALGVSLCFRLGHL